MIVKQYVVTLPADYDMKIIRERVATKGTSFDTFPGLGIKAFTIREKGLFGAESNQYAPVYCWPEVEPMWGFIAGAGFRGILESFGWTPIETWLGLAFARSGEPRDLTNLRSVVRTEQTISPGVDLAELREREIIEARSVVTNASGVLVRAVGLNPQTWSLVHFDFWTCTQDALPADSHSYEVLHVSAPNPDALGRTGLPPIGSVG